MLGSAAVMILDETTCMVRAAARLAKFFAHESCGQCTPCREGTNWAAIVLKRIEHGHGKPSDLDLMLRMTQNMSGTTICALSDAAVGPCRSVVTNFREEVEEHIREQRCPLPAQRFFSSTATAVAQVAH
jgi:NADH-quinone oxidoreductase subunit F